MRKNEIITNKLPADYTYNQYMEAVIQEIGGPQRFKDLLPYPVPHIAKYLEEDEHLNNIPLDLWDKACGFKEIGLQPVRYMPTNPYHPLRDAIRNILHESWSISEYVSLLKHIAIMLAKEYKFQMQCCQ